MSTGKYSVQNGIGLTLPIFMTYDVLAGHLREKMKGEIIHKENDKGKIIKYAEIRNIDLVKSVVPEFDLLITINLKTLTLLYRHKDLDIDIKTKLKFDNEQQKISVDFFEIDSRGGGWLADQVLESIVNNLMNDKLKKKLTFDLRPQISQQLSSINKKWMNDFVPRQGVHIKGEVEKLNIRDLATKEDGLWVFLDINGWTVVEIVEIPN